MYRKAFRIIIFIVVAAMLLVGCSGKELTPEEEEELRLAAEAQEEEATGLKKLTSVNLTDAEQPFADFVEGMQSMNADKVAASMGVVNIFDEGLQSWIINNDFELFQERALSDIRIDSDKSGAHCDIYVFFEAPNEERSNFVTYQTDYVGDQWIVTPPSGLIYDFVFFAPSNDVAINGVSMSDYAEADFDYAWKYTVPRMVACSSTPGCTFTTSFGSYEGKLQKIGSELSRSNFFAVAEIPDSQKEEMNAHLADCLSNVFELARNGAAAEEYSKYLLDADEVSSLIPKSEEEAAQLIEIANSVTAVSVMPAYGTAGYSDDYVYHFVNDKSISMTVRFSATTNGGECHKLATIVMGYTNDSWKIISIDSNTHLFTDVSPFNPEW